MTSANLSTAYISLGSNIEPLDNLRRAVALLGQHCTLRAVSHAYRTPPQGYTDQPDFLNAAVKITTSMDVLTFKHTVLDGIERELKRERDPNNKNAPRTIDLDISLWNDEVFEYGDKPWRVPDPDILRFAHVALPLAEIAPDYIHPAENCPLDRIGSRFTDAHFDRIHLA